MTFSSELLPYLPSNVVSHTVLHAGFTRWVENDALRYCHYSAEVAYSRSLIHRCLLILCPLFLLQPGDAPISFQVMSFCTVN